MKTDKKRQSASGDISRMFAEEKMLPLIIRISIPSIVAQLVNMLYGIVDRIFIGHIPGEGTLALAGVGVCNTIIILVSAFAQFAAGGAASLASIELGKGNKQNAQRLMNNALMLVLVLSGFLMAAVYLFMRPILFAIGASAQTISYAAEYLTWYMAGTPFVLITLGLNPFLNVQGYVWTAMATVAIGAALNIILDPIFIYTLHMGVAGAAAATILSQAASAVWILLFLRSARSTLHLSKNEMRPDAKMLKKIGALGVSPFVMGSTESIIGFVMNKGLAAYGDIYVSTLTIMQSCMQIYSVPLNGFSSGASPAISYNYGRGDTARVKAGFRIVVTIMTSFNFIMTLWMILKPQWFASIFTADPELISMVTKIMPVFLSGMLIFGMQRACQTTFIALNQPRVSLFIALLRKIFLLVPLALILPHFWGYMGIYGAEAIADGTAAVCCILIFLYRFPKILKSMQEENRSKMTDSVQE